MKKILIIEDDECTRMIYRTRLQAEGFATEAVADGRAGIEQLTSSPPDLVLLDLMLPQVSGIEVLKFLRAQESTGNLPVIVLTNAYEHGATEAARKAGANLCLSKSDCTPRNLVHAVRIMLAAADPESAVCVKAPALVALAESDGSNTITESVIKNEMRQRVSELRQSFLNVGKSDEISRSNHLLELRRAVHGVAGGAGLAGLTHLARTSCALEALLNELHAKPQRVNPSSLRTTAQAIDLLAVLVENASVLQSRAWAAPRILVVDDETISRQTVCMALKKADLTATALGDPIQALKLLADTRFDLIFLDVEMPGLNGFDVCRRLHATAANAATPVVFVTALTDFDTRARSNLSGGTDIIAKPVSLIELAVKALIHLFRARLHSVRTPANAVPLSPAGVVHAGPADTLIAA